MNDYSQYSENHVSEEDLAFLSSLILSLVQEWDLREEPRRLTDTVSTLIRAYCQLCSDALACIIEMFEFSVNDSVGKWLHYRASRPDCLAKTIFLDRFSKEMAGKLEEMFERLSLRTVEALNARIQRELSDNGCTVLPYNYLNLKDFQLKWSEAFAKLAVETVFDRIDAMQLDEQLPPCETDEGRSEIMRKTGIMLVPRMEYEVNKIRIIISSYYRSTDAFCEFSDEVSLSLWFWLEGVDDDAE